MDQNHLTIKTFMAIMAERDAAIQERNLALVERKRAFAERDMAILQRDTALAERDSAMQERDEAVATVRCRGDFMHDIMSTPDLPQIIPGHGTKHSLSDEEMHHMFEMPENNYNQREPHVKSDKYQATNAPPENPKPRKVKVTSPRAGKRSGSVNIEPRIGRNEETSDDAELEAWKDELGFNQVNSDESAMPVPFCSCTGVPQPCYRWGHGGWQSACCTTTMSIYPLPQASNKRNSRVGGRKMSGGVFTKLLTRLAAEGYDRSTPLDLKDHWAKHGTNRYSKV